MKFVRVAVTAAVIAVGVAALTAAPAPIDARMFRYPDVSATRIAFVYAGDIWTVPRAGIVSAVLARRHPHRLQRQL